MTEESKNSIDEPLDDSSLDEAAGASAEAAIAGDAPTDPTAPPESEAGGGDVAGESDANDDEPKIEDDHDDDGEAAQWADEEDLEALAAEHAADAEDDDVGFVAPVEELSDEETKPKIEQKPKDWYILKVQSNREDSIADALRRRVKVAGMEEHFDEIIVPVEMVTEFKAGKKRIVKRKLYPGYIVVHMSISDETWFLVRETPGIGDFTGSAGRPTPMLPHEVARIVPKDEDVETEEPKLQIGVSLGDRVKINEGTFENFEGEVDTIDETNGRVTVMINIFGRSTPVELEYWQIEKL